VVLRGQRDADGQRDQVSVLHPQTRLALVAVRDIGTAAAAAIAEPERFDQVELELAGDYLSMTEIAEVLSRALGRPVPAPDMTEPEALAAGMPAMGASHEWMNVNSQPAGPPAVRERPRPPGHQLR